MPVIPMKAPVRAECVRRVWIDLLLAPMAVMVALVLSLGMLTLPLFHESHNRGN